eukprot:gnl/MRDRNA2_/MRDRNA2_66675_c0_seq1.p1 gnl/MRDRNA2_/MRDRNA2_66675_c0~~gnl/MRDRNA2_/MRDRNA2_66675_c0_seq1.p1  ORF type:complete len:629 (+),score=103.27 gnl/MRDRNA2_/MRDRNA2_66675_c0_seq1:333-2219(+)
MDLQIGLDLLFLRTPASYYALASLLMSAVRRVTGEQGLQAIDKDKWLEAYATAIGGNDDDRSQAELLTHLQNALRVVSNGRARRLALQQMVVSSTFRKLAPPISEEFPKQPIEGMSVQERRRAKLEPLEPCPPGYSFVRMLGGGAFAKVFLVRHDNLGHCLAMKRIDREHMKKAFGLSPEAIERMIELEVQHMDSIHHPHVVKLSHFYQDIRYAYFMMETAKGGSLQELVNKVYSPSQETVRGLTEAYVANVLQQILRALQSLHRDRRIHKDLKLENLMLLASEGSPHVLVIDFGLVEAMSEDMDSRGPSPAGTIETMAPEVIDTFLGRRPQGFDERCDIYSVGIVTFQLLTGRLPYEITHTRGKKGVVDYESTRANMENVDIQHLLMQAGRSKELADLVSRMLHTEPDKRPTALECLRHEWSLKHREGRRHRYLRTAGKFSLNSAGLEAKDSTDVVSAGEKLLTAKRQAIAQALLEFSQKTLAQRKVVYHLVSFMPMMMLPRVTESYQRIDERLEGVLSHEDVAEALMFDLGIDEPHARQVAAALNIDDSGIIDFRQFSAACCSLSEENARKCVGWLIDKAHKDNLSLEEVGELTQKAASDPVHGAEIAQWLKESFEHLQGLEGIAQ